jgi:hypothetical protein
MLLLMLFFTVIGSWHMNQTIRDSAEADLDSVKANEGISTVTQLLAKQRNTINRKFLLCQAIYFFLSLTLTIQVQVIFSRWE